MNLYSTASSFNQPIPEDPRIHPDSDHLVGGLRKAKREQGFVIALKRWTFPVYFAKPSTPRRRISFTARWAPARALAGVPIPRRGKPDPAGDGHLVILDRSTGCEYDFWQARQRGGRWKASWGNSIRYDGDGAYPQGYSARGSGFAALAGSIWPHELEQGLIDHALVFSYNFVAEDGAVPPATESDGDSARGNALPEGARIQLDPDLDLDSLDLHPYERTIAQALQTYGMFLADSGGGISLYAINPISVRGNPYEGLLPNVTYPSLSNIPLRSLRVIDFPEPVPDEDLPRGLVDSGCGTMIP